MCPEHTVPWWAHSLQPSPGTTWLWPSQCGQHTIQAPCCSSGKQASMSCLLVLASSTPGECFWPWLQFLPAHFLYPEGYFLLAGWLWSSSGPGNPLSLRIHWHVSIYHTLPSEVWIPSLGRSPFLVCPFVRLSLCVRLLFRVLFILLQPFPCYSLH